jgi:hypothetical protein
MITLLAQEVRGMVSVPGAVRGPRAGSPRGVVDATGSASPAGFSKVPPDPVATAPGTDTDGADDIRKPRPL